MDTKDNFGIALAILTLLVAAVEFAREASGR